MTKASTPEWTHEEVRFADSMSGTSDMTYPHHPVCRSQAGRSKKRMRLKEERCKDHCDDAHQLQKNVDGRAGGVLERVTDGVTGDSCLVGV